LTQPSIQSINRQVYDFQILIGVSKKGIRPTLPPFCPEELKMMIASCWAVQPEKRPDCGFLLVQLNMIKGLPFPQGLNFPSGVSNGIAAGREYNKNKEQWDSLLPSRPPGAITPPLKSGAAQAAQKNGTENDHGPSEKSQEKKKKDKDGKKKSKKDKEKDGKKKKKKKASD